MELIFLAPIQNSLGSFQHSVYLKQNTAFPFASVTAKLFKLLTWNMRSAVVRILIIYSQPLYNNNLHGGRSLL